VVNRVRSQEGEQGKEFDFRLVQVGCRRQLESGTWGQQTRQNEFEGKCESLGLQPEPGCANSGLLQESGSQQCQRADLQLERQRNHQQVARSRQPNRDLSIQPLEQRLSPLQSTQNVVGSATCGRAGSNRGVRQKRL